MIFFYMILAFIKSYRDLKLTKQQGGRLYLFRFFFMVNFFLSIERSNYEKSNVYFWTRLVSMNTKIKNFVEQTKIFAQSIA